MLTCKTPPYSVPSKQNVKLTVDSVERYAPMPFTYNQDPIIKSIQPSRSFVRLVIFVRNGVFSLYFSSVLFSTSVWWPALTCLHVLIFRNGLDITLCQCQLDKFPSNLSSCIFLRPKGGTKERKQGWIWLRIFVDELRQINALVLQQEEMSRRWRVAKLLTLTAGSSQRGSTVSLSDADANIRSHPPHTVAEAAQCQLMAPSSSPASSPRWSSPPVRMLRCFMWWVQEGFYIPKWNIHQLDYKVCTVWVKFMPWLSQGDFYF